MANLRLLKIKVIDSTTIRARFTDDLDPLINTANVVVTPNIPSVPEPTVLEVEISSADIIITTRPMTPYAAYFVEFRSTLSTKFKSKDGSSFLLEDGTTNVPLVIGPEDPADPIRTYLIHLLKDNVYNLQTGTIIRDAINSQSKVLTRALYDIRQAKNDNYLTDIVYDELKVRGGGPYDRLQEEGAYEIIRVGRQQAGSTASTSFSFTSFPRGPVTLLATPITNERLTIGSGPGTFDKLILTVNKFPVTKLNSVVFEYASGARAEYDISQLGYRIQDSRYDESYASTLLTLDTDQFKLSSSILDGGYDIPAAGDTIVVSYEYKSEGRVVDEESVTVSQVLNATRETAPAIITEFTTDYFPIVTATDKISGFGGIEFLDPESNPPFFSTHPAFIKELPFKYDGLPANPGEYTVDYETGRIFVYGAVTSDGTGNYPPVMNYKYRNTFDSRLDYTYDPDTSDLAASPLRDLTGQTAKISFDYEQALTPEIDYVPQVHAEVLDERIENRINASNAVRVAHGPITNVFRIYNETSGEIYKVTRWSDDTVYYSYTVSPRIIDVNRERAEFTDILNETLIVDNEVTNSIGVRIFVIDLKYNRIFSTSEDVIGSSFNSSVSFSRSDIFKKELYFDSQILSVSDNIDRLKVGRYQVDYVNGVVYLGVTAIQDFDLGTINYKNYNIKPQNPHLISVSEIYHQISEISVIDKKINYTIFGDDFITPSTFDRSDERFLNGDTTLPYFVTAGTITVSDDIKNIRNIYDVYDLNNNENPTNFAEGATFSANVITLDADGILSKVSSVIDPGLTIDVPFVSAGVEIASVTSVVRISDGQELYDAGGSFSGYTITLSGAVGAPVPGQAVFITYHLRMNGGATPVVDYNRGDYYIDYTYLADEILVSYEYGDNVLDFRNSGALDEGDQYFVSYKVGALRSGLLKNFGSLVDVPVLNNFDTTLPRERYRDALKAALQSFTRGPTIPSITDMVAHITHIDPEIVEGVFEAWSLGISNLYLNAIDYTEGISLLPAKFDLGVLIDDDGETITFPTSSNLRLEEGTLEMWVIPEWNGLDNDATLTFEVFKKDGTHVAADDIYIGASSYHPTMDLNNRFVVNRKDVPSPIGLPSAIFNQVGFFIYYDEYAKRWNVLARAYVGNKAYDGYHIMGGAVYYGTIESSGEVYDAKWIPGLGEIDDVLRSGMEKIEFKFNLDGYDVLSPDGYKDGYNDGYVPGYSFDGITFMADNEHYLFDFGKTESTNRFSLYKDGRGYLNFRVFDNGNAVTNRKNQFKVSADISDWLAGQKHHVAVSWKLNTSDRQDEMHLFIDGFEMPNIMRYGGRPVATSSDRFRTVKPEIVAGVVPLNVVTNNDMHTVAGSNMVYSDSVNFTSEGIVVGNTIHILEPGFTTYNILAVIGNTLQLDSAMPSTFDDARFSVNEYSVVVSSEINLFNNIAVSIISGGVETEIPGLRADIPSYSISKNVYNEDVLSLLGSAKAGDQIAIRTLGLNHRRARARQYVWGNTSSVIKTQLPPPIYLDEAKIYPVLYPIESIGPHNSVLIGGRFFAAGLTTSQPSNDTEGRTLAVRMTGGNVNFSTPPVVTIFGVTPSGPLAEVLTFNSPSIQNTTNKFLTVASINIEATPIVTTQNSVSVEIKEAFPITFSEGNLIFPVLRFSYKTQMGKTLEGTGSNVVTDHGGYFVDSNVGQKLVINSPAAVAGTYTITGRIDTTNITITPAPPIAFSNGNYSVFNVTLGRSGFQNGFFTFEVAGATNEPFPLKQGWYEFDYSAHLEIPMDPVNNIESHIGSDMNSHKPANAIIDEFRILSTQLTDVRVGESLAENEDSITTDYTALREFIANSDTLMLLHFNELPLSNDADFWVTSTRDYLQSGSSVNSNFDKSLIVADKPLVYDNSGRLQTLSEGSIEFWVSPKFDTYNDPNFRFYFDASGSLEEETTSLTNGTVQLSRSAASIFSVRLQTDVDNDGVDYFAGGRLLSDFQTINLGKALPAQQTPVKINYIPSGLSGDRISIYKDQEGFITFNVRAVGIDYQVRHPVFWSRDSWHRVRATYKFNRADNQDEIRLFIDGEERGAVRFGADLLFGQGLIFGQGFAGVDNSVLIDDINFSDPINEFFIGSDYLRANTAQARIDNLRLSNVSRDPLVIAGQSTDVNFSQNLNIVYPVIEDAFTTFLMNFDTVKFKADDFALLKDDVYGIFNFTINIIDSFNIVSSDAKVQQVLESLINALKPAQSKVTLNYIR